MPCGSGREPTSRQTLRPPPRTRPGRRDARARERGRDGALARVLLVACALLGGSAAAAEPPGADSVRVRLEVGASSDITNEQFYEDAYLADTTFLGRRLVSTPEARHAGVMQLAIRGTRAGRRQRYELRQTLSLGDRLQRAVAEAEATAALGERWRLSFAPRGDVRHDRTLGRDLTETQAAAVARVRRDVGAGDDVAEAGLAADLLRASGRGADLLLDRNACAASLDWDHAGLGPATWRAEWRVALRSFPDSTERSHLEHAWQGQWRWLTGAGHALALEVEGTRRGTLRAAPTTRDQFADGRAAVELELGSLAAWSWRARGEGELLRYDHEDSVLYVNTRVLRALSGPRWQPNPRLSLGAFVRLEGLTSPRDPVEEYQETAGELALEWTGLRGWWSVAPSAGRRRYTTAPPAVASAALPGAHSSFDFYELTLFGDQPLPGALVLRVAGTGRLERHDDPVQNAGSLYLSIDLRRVF